MVKTLPSSRSSVKISKYIPSESVDIKVALKVSSKGKVLLENDQPIDGLFACGEIVGGVFLAGYPGGSGLTSGAVFGKIAGMSAGELCT